jgi:hypothetical protein
LTFFPAGAILLGILTWSPFAMAKTQTQARYFEQEFLKPGRYHIGGGRFADVTAKDIAQHVGNTRRLIQAGYAPPVLLAHAKPGSKAGAPVLETAASKVKNGVGWLDNVRVGEDGSAVHLLRITDPAAAEKLENGSIAFASPELRPEWTDGRGRSWENIISHMALTHKPRNPDQGKFTEVVPVPMAQAGVAQYSLDDMVSLGDDEDEDDEEGGVDLDGDGDADTADDDMAAEDLGNGSEMSEIEEDDEDEGPDMPAPGDASSLKLQERLRAVIAHLSKLGVVLPEDTVEADTNVMLDRLLTGLLTANASKDMAEAADDEEEDGDLEEGGGEKPQVIEQRGIGQFSCDALDRAPSLVRKVIKHERANLGRRLNRLVANSQITPAGRALLLAHRSAMQFSADGSFIPLLTVPQLVSFLEKTTVPGAALTPEGLGSQFSVEDHFDGEAHREKSGGTVSPADAVKLVDQQATKLRGVFSR